MSPARFAQHFLINQEAVHRIIQSLNLQKTDLVLEIGPGQGSLTKQLIHLSDRVSVVEVDKKMVDILQSSVGDDHNLVIYNEDILEFDFNKLRNGKSGSASYKIVGNLPYNLTSPILRRLESWDGWSEASLMVQKEVGDRICATVGSSEYGALTVGVHLTCEADHLFDLDEKAFRPPPRVLSSVVKLRRRPESLTNQIDRTQKVIQAAFQQRRKTILNSLSHGLQMSKDHVGTALDRLNISKESRAQNLTVSQFISVTNELIKSRNE